MRVTGVRSVLVTAPWTGDPFWATGEPFERSAALVVVETDEGVTGVGETIMGYFHAEVVAPLIDYYAHLLQTLPLDPARKALGSNVLFRESFELGYRINPVWQISVYLDHVSNAGFARYNQSLNEVGGRIGMRF